MLKKLLGSVLKPPVPQLVGLVLLTSIVYFGGRMARPLHGRMRRLDHRIRHPAPLMLYGRT